MIKPKKKLCRGACGRITFIWAHGKCKECDAKENPKEGIRKSVTPIAKMSGKRKKEMGQYLKLRLDFLNENKTCKAKIHGCSGQATDVHHMAGKIGVNFLDTTKWVALCRSCHTYIELHPNIAKELGFSLHRL